MSNSQLSIKLFIFSIAYLLLFEATRFIADEFTTQYMHAPSIWNDIFDYIGVYAAIGFGAAIGWKTKPLHASTAFLIPLPMSIYQVIKMDLTGIYNQIYPGTYYVIKFHIFEHAIPCLLAAVLISYARRRT